MTEPLRWSSIPTPAPPVVLASASASAVLAWVGRDGALFWQPPVCPSPGGPSPASDPVSLARIDGVPLDLAVSAAGDHVAWLTKDGAGWIAAPGGEARRVSATAGYGAVTFVDGHLLCAPSRAAGDVLVVSTRSEETRSIALGRLGLDGLAAALRDHGLGGTAETTALWIAMAAGLAEAENIVAPRRLRIRRQVEGSSIALAAGRPALLVYLRGGRLVRIRFQAGTWHRTELQSPPHNHLAEGRGACLHPDGRHVAAPLDSTGRTGGARTVVFGAGGKIIATWRPRPPGRPLAFRCDGCLAIAGAEGGLDLWRVPGVAGDVHGSGTALACAGAHLASFALRSVHPADRPVAPSIHLLARLWRVGIHPPLVWVHDLLALLDGGEVGVPPGMDPERAPEDYRRALLRLAESAGLRRLRGIRPGRPALETTVARLLRSLAQSAAGDDLRPPRGEADLVREALLRAAGAGGVFGPEDLLPPGTAEAWEEALSGLDLDELRTIDVLGDAALGLPGCLAEGFAVDLLPDAVRAVLSAVMRILPREVEKRNRRDSAASAGGLGGYGEITRKGNLDNLLPTEHAYPRQFLWGRMLQGEALYYGRESPPPSLHESTWLVIDASAAMTGDPLLLARAVGVAAARRAGRRVRFRFFDAGLGPSQPIARPGDLWQLIHGPPRLPPGGDQAADALTGTAAVWQGLLRGLQARPEGDGRVHIVVVSHELLGAEEAGVVVDGLAEVSEHADLRLVLVQFPEVESWFEPHSARGFEPWMMRGPSLVPERPPWKVLRERGVPVALIPVTRLWGLDD